jgi:hypothetical protein
MGQMKQIKFIILLILSNNIKLFAIDEEKPFNNNVFSSENLIIIGLIIFSISTISFFYTRKTFQILFFYAMITGFSLIIFNLSYDYGIYFMSGLILINAIFKGTYGTPDTSSSNFNPTNTDPKPTQLSYYSSEKYLREKYGHGNYDYAKSELNKKRNYDPTPSQIKDFLEKGK